MSYSFYREIELYQIILGSQSPRRKQLLNDLRLSFEVQIRPVDETIPETFTGSRAAVYIAEQKWLPFRNECAMRNHIVITADTIVCLGTEVIGKPADENEAVTMLRKLSGRMHEVFTGVKLGNDFYSESFSVKTEVWFRELSDEDIRFYVQEYKPFDKAGAYGAQDWIGLTAVEKINGSFYNVMGLPVKEVYESLHRFLNAMRQ